MSVYRPKDAQGRSKSPYFQYDFRVKVLGQGKPKRFHGSTGQKTRRAAEEYENRVRELAALGQLSNDITVEQACWRYWDEVAQHRRASDDEAKNLEYLSRFLGSDTLLVLLTPAMVAEAASARLKAPIERTVRIGRSLELAPTKHMPLPATVNRQIIEPLRRLLKRAKTVWRIPLDLEQFDWGALRYSEGDPRVRELSTEEELRLWVSLREDYHPLIEMYIISGRRRSDWVDLTKFKVDRTARTARFPTRKRKGIGEILVHLTDREMEIINEEWAKAPQSSHIFTYVVAKGANKGERRPITATGLRKVTDAAFKKAGLENFKRHDFRHTFASRALRGKGDLRTLMAAMDHQDISSTVRYAHMADNQAAEMRSGVSVTKTLPANVKSFKKDQA